jgi:hypothetical protein
MITRQLFIGEKAVDSILEIAKNVNRQFIELAKKRWNSNAEEFQPWMCIPSNLGNGGIPLDWPTHSLFLKGKDLTAVRGFIESLDSEKRPLPSMENYPIRVSNLSSVEEEEFIAKILDARASLVTTVPWIGRLLDNLVQHFVPVESLTDDGMDYGMSTVWLKGAIFFEKKQLRSLELRTESLAHELAHQILIHYQLSDRLIERLNEPVYSAIRKTERPAIMTFHGAAALSYMLLAARNINNSERVNILTNDLKETLKSLSAVKLTAVGEIILKEMDDFANA